MTTMLDEYAQSMTHPQLSVVGGAGPRAAPSARPAPPQGGPRVPQPPAAECEACEWFIAQHKPFQGPSTVIRLREQGFQAHSFREEVRRPGRDDTLVPLFPGYLFVGMHLDNAAWSALLQVRGVLAILTASGRPAALPPGCAEALIATVDDHDIRHAPTPHSPVGQDFTVSTGPWANWAGRCVSARGDRVGLLLEVFGRQSVLEFSRGHVMVTNISGL